MSFTATVQNDTIKLPPGVHLPDGTKVVIEQEDKVGASELRARSPAFASVLKHAGTVESLPEDFAARHDDYIRGRESR